MARRPEDTRGTLIFQEGKNIEGDFYIIAVYDDPASCRITFSAYELENDCTYTYQLTYSEYDNLFRFNSELMNPNNVLGRIHWVMDRLQFIEDHRGPRGRAMALDDEGYKETEILEQEEEEIIATPKKQGVQPAAAGSGSVDAITRARLLQELDTADDEKRHMGLVKCEGARKRFIAALFAKRELEQLKSTQRLQKADEDREERLTKLDVIKEHQHAKALEHKRKAEQQKSTMAQLEVLLKQKEAQAIRRLIQEKDESDRGMGREKDAARQRRKMQERSANEVAAIENQRAQQLARNREQQVLKREQLVRNKGVEEFQKVQALFAAEKTVNQRRRNEKDQIIEDEWTRKREIREDKERRKSEFERLEKVRNEHFHETDVERARRDRSRWLEVRKAYDEEVDAIETRHRNSHKDFLLQWSVDATRRAVAVRANQNKNAIREKALLERSEAKQRQLQEAVAVCVEENLRKENAASNTAPSRDASPVRSSSPSPRRSTSGTRKKGITKLSKKGKAKKDAVVKKPAPDTEVMSKEAQRIAAANAQAAEVLRVLDWRQVREKAKLAKENARLQRELTEEQAAWGKIHKIAKQEVLSAQLETKRQEAERERQAKRHQACLERVQSLPVGCDLPMGMVMGNLMINC